MSEEKEQKETQLALNTPTGTIFPIQFVQAGALSDVPAPLVRITTCGEMKVEVLHEVLSTNPPQGRYVVVTPQQRRKGSTTGRNLLSALVSLPGHYAAKSWLTERLCRPKSEDDEDDAWGGIVRVDNIVTLLRGLLCPPGIAGEKELRTMLVRYVLNRFESGSGYQLAGAPLLWLDVDVIEASVKEACQLEQQGHDALAVWERAYALAARGGYLLDERYSDWAEDKRQEMEGYQRQAIHALHRLYLAQKGDSAEEQVLLILRSYWQNHLIDEDVLRPLLEILGKRGCVQEAEMFYLRLCQELEKDGLTPHARTQRTMQNVRVEQHISALSIKDEIPTSVLPVISQRIHQRTNSIDSIAPFQSSRNLPDSELHERLRYALRKPSAVDRATLEHLESIANNCWRLIPAVAGLVSRYSREYVLEHLEGITRLLEASQSTRIHEQLCSIASTFALIIANISSNMGDYSTAKIYYELSIDAALEARNASLQAVGLARLSFNFTRSDRPDMALPLVHEAHRLVTQNENNATVITRSWIAAALAEVYASVKNAEACFDVLEQAVLPSGRMPEEDPYHTTFSSSLLAGYKGVCYTLLCLPENAENILYEALKQLPATATYQRGYILSDLAHSCLQQNKVEETYRYASDALTAAVQTKSPEIFHRVRKVRGNLHSRASTSYGKSLDQQLDDVERYFSTKRG